MVEHQNPIQHSGPRVDESPFIRQPGGFPVHDKSVNLYSNFLRMFEQHIDTLLRAPWQKCMNYDKKNLKESYGSEINFWGGELVTPEAQKDSEEDISFYEIV